MRPFWATVKRIGPFNEMLYVIVLKVAYQRAECVNEGEDHK